MKCPTFDQIELVLCEDGQTVMAYAYPNADDDEGLVVLVMDPGEGPNGLSAAPEIKRGAE